MGIQLIFGENVNCSISDYVLCVFFKGPYKILTICIRILQACLIFYTSKTCFSEFAI